MSDLNIKRFLDFEGLSDYDALLKAYISDINNSGSIALDAEVERAQEAEKALIEALAALGEVVDDHEDKLNTLMGDGEGSIQATVEKAVTDLIDGAPETLDTLKEIADWIENDETGTAALIDRVATNEDDIVALKEKDEELKEYIDAQDKAYFDSILSIEDLKIASLFPAVQGAEESAIDAINAVEEGKAVKLTADQEIAEDIAINKSCYIDANGSTFNGTVIIPKDADVIIENATFSKPVVVA